jgi:hypothetical protein
MEQKRVKDIDRLAAKHLEERPRRLRRASAVGIERYDRNAGGTQFIGNPAAGHLRYDTQMMSPCDETQRKPLYDARGPAVCQVCDEEKNFQELGRRLERYDFATPRVINLTPVDH